MTAPSAAELVKRLDASYRNRWNDDSQWLMHITDAWVQVRALLVAAPPREPDPIEDKFHADVHRASVWLSQALIDYDKAVLDAALGGRDQSAAGGIACHPPITTVTGSAADHAPLVARLDALLRNELATKYPLMADLVREARDALARQVNLWSLRELTMQSERDELNARIDSMADELAEARKAVMPWNWLLMHLDGFSRDVNRATAQAIDAARAGDQQTAGSEVVGGKQPRDEPSGPNR